MGIVLTLKKRDLRDEDGRTARVYNIQEDKFRTKTLPKDANENAKPAFRHDGTNFIFPKGCPAVDKIIEAIEQVAEETFKDKAPSWIKKNLGEGNATDNCCLKDGEERDTVTEDFADTFFLNGKGQRRVLILTPAGVEVGDALDEDVDGDEIDEDDVVYSGMHIGALKVEVWGYTKGKGGVACNVLGWRGLDHDAEAMESQGGETASKDDLGMDDDDDEDEVETKPKKAPPKKAPPKKK